MDKIGGLTPLFQEMEVNGCTYYVKRLHEVPDLVDECCEFINKEWKRSYTARLRSIEGSSERFPMSLVLLKASEKPELVGHCRISRLSMSSTKVFVETVVIHPELRGKGLGRFLMNVVEDMCKSKGIKQIYLSTRGQEGFYEKIGYTKCPPVSLYGCQFYDSDDESSKVEQVTSVPVTVLINNRTNIPPPPPPPLPKTFIHVELNTVTSRTFMFKFDVAAVVGISAYDGKLKAKMKDFTTNNYCDFLWISDLLELKRDSKNEFIFEIPNGPKSVKCNIVNVIIFGMIVEVKEVGYKGAVYQVDDGTGVIACKRTEEQFEQIMTLIEQEQGDALNQTVDALQSFEQSFMVDTSADDSVFNDRSIQIEDINFNKKIQLKGLQSIWDDIYKTFSSLIEPYSIGDSVMIYGKLYNYFNVNQIYINHIRAMDLAEEIMELSNKLENGYEELKEAGNSKMETGTEKRMSGLVTFDNLSKPQHKITVPNIEMPEWKDMLSPGIVTPNLNPTITFDTFTRCDELNFTEFDEDKEADCCCTRMMRYLHSVQTGRFISSAASNSSSSVPDGWFRAVLCFIKSGLTSSPP